MQVNLLNKIFYVCGLHGTGKTNLLKYIALQHHTVIFDTSHEWDVNRYHVYRPTASTYPQITIEAEQFLSFLKKQNYIVNGKKIDMIIFSEAESIFPNRKTLPPVFSEFLREHRRLRVAIGLDGHRPTTINTTLMSLAQYIFIFRLTGKNDLDYLKQLNFQIGDMPVQLQPYHFIVLDPNRNMVISEPVPLV